MGRSTTSFLTPVTVAAVRRGYLQIARRCAVRFSPGIPHWGTAGVVCSVLALGFAGCGRESTPIAATTVASVAVNGTAPGVGASAQLSATAALSDGTTQIVTSQATWAS